LSSFDDNYTQEHTLNSLNDTSTLRGLIRELMSPLGDSTLELRSDIEEIIKQLDVIVEDIFERDPALAVKLRASSNDLKKNMFDDQRKISRSVQELLTLIVSSLPDETEGLQLRLQTLLRRLPVVSTYDSQQSELNPPEDPTKSGRFNRI